jgi:aminocarboxymuconate-semialdehyde decarboxylase
MLNINQFVRSSTGLFAASCGIGPSFAHRHAMAPADQRGGGTPKPASRRTTTIGGRRVRTVDVHAHVLVQDVLEVVQGTKLEKPIRHQLKTRLSMPVGPERLDEMDANGVDVAAMSINPLWYAADKDLAGKMMDVQNRKLAELCAVAPDRFQAYAAVALQFPEMAAKQLEHAVKELGLCGAAIGGSVNEEELANPKFDPFWAKAEELQALIFLHPQANAWEARTPRVKGNGALRNVIGNPLETTYALSHLILEGTLDKFPRLKLCAAHGGGFLPSYPSRMDYAPLVFPDDCDHVTLKKKPSEYLRQLYIDSLVFTGENLRHLVEVCGASQIMLGTDHPIPWVPDPVGHVLDAPLSDADKIAILGGTAAKLMRL